MLLSWVFCDKLVGNQFYLGDIHDKENISLLSAYFGKLICCCAGGKCADFCTPPFYSGIYYTTNVGVNAGGSTP